MSDSILQSMYSGRDEKRELVILGATGLQTVERIKEPQKRVAHQACGAGEHLDRCHSVRIK